MPKRMRRKYYIDRDVQGALLKRVIRYWLVCVAAVGMMTLTGWLFISPGLTGFVGSSAQMAMVLPIFVMAILASLLILPAVVFDVIKLSNRFAGPMYRLRRVMDDLAAGKSVNPIVFRDGDFWTEFAVTFNALVARVERQQRELDAHDKVDTPTVNPSETELQEVGV